MGLFGAAHTPADGHVDPTGATHALAAVARSSGAEIRCRSPARRIRQIDDGRWEVETETGIQSVPSTWCWQPVSGPANWRSKSGWIFRFLPSNITRSSPTTSPNWRLWMGKCPPFVTLAHHQMFETGTTFALLCGVYENNPVLWAVDGIPPEFGQELLVPDMERLEAHLLKRDRTDSGLRRSRHQDDQQRSVVLSAGRLPDGRSGSLPRRALAGIGISRRNRDRRWCGEVSCRLDGRWRAAIPIANHRSCTVRRSGREGTLLRPDEGHLRQGLRDPVVIRVATAMHDRTAIGVLSANSRRCGRVS